jgi:hypothetical protein
LLIITQLYRNSSSRHFARKNQKRVAAQLFFGFTPMQTLLDSSSFWVFQRRRRWKTQNWFFESQPAAGFQKTNF